VEIDVYENKIINVEIPNHVVLEITYTEPGLKGDTSGTARKPAEVETGLNVNVPLFIENGDFIKIDTRTGEYIERM
jgi:elongation factor P